MEINQGIERSAINALPQEYCCFLVNYYEQSLAAKPESLSYGCMIPSKQPSEKDGGYVKIALFIEDYKRAGVPETIVKSLFPSGNSKAERNIYLHVIAFKAKHGYVPDGRHRHVSHLCDVPSCFHDGHLVDEDAETNNRRKNCRRCLLLPPEYMVADGRRVVVLACNGHGSDIKCIIPTEYLNCSQYYLINNATSIDKNVENCIEKGGPPTKGTKNILE